MFRELRAVVVEEKEFLQIEAVTETKKKNEAHKSTR